MNFYIKSSEKYTECLQILVALKLHIYVLFYTNLLKFLTFKFLDSWKKVKVKLLSHVLLFVTLWTTAH